MRADRAGDEPVPGYKLARMLGQGRFGWVWRATGPDGLTCALKFLPLNDGQGAVELRRVARLKQVRHPRLAPIIGCWLRDDAGQITAETEEPPAEFDGGELIIVRGAGEKTLAQRLVECRQGVTAGAFGGMSMDELLDLLAQAADAVDFLNRAVHAVGSNMATVPHGGIHPGNLILAAGGLWLGDYGLAAAFGTPARNAPAYAAPEIIHGASPSAASDQFSLAVSYVELRSGRLPFEGCGPAVVPGRLGAVTLDLLSGREQAVLRQALADAPDERFPNCVEFVRALEDALRVGHLLAPDPSGSTVRPPLPEDLFCRHREIVPGYRLEKCLGKGGYGEVWQALGPGKTKVALKIVKDLGGMKGKQEWQALEATKDELDHPHLMKMQAFWLLDARGQVIPDEEQNLPGGPQPAYLVILSELAVRNLQQRLKECHELGLPGIPQRELMEYIRQAARALDYLNTRKSNSFGERGAIVHRDIKPENLLLTRSGDIKVCDFGLAKFMDGTVLSVSTNSQGMTPYYAAPELLRKKLTRWTDQYSLAITYYHLRTGRLPLDTNLPQIEQWMQLGEGRLDLSGLPEPERVIIERATQLEPTERYPNCTELVAGLFGSVGLPLPDLAPAEELELPTAPVLGDLAADIAAAVDAEPLRTGEGGADPALLKLATGLTVTHGPNDPAAMRFPAPEVHSTQVASREIFRRAGSSGEFLLNPSTGGYPSVARSGGYVATPVTPVPFPETVRPTPLRRMLFFVAGMVALAWGAANLRSMFRTSAAEPVTPTQASATPVPAISPEVAELNTLFATPLPSPTQTARALDLLKALARTSPELAAAGAATFESWKREGEARLATLGAPAVAELIGGLLQDDVAGRAAYESAAGLLPRLPEPERAKLADELNQHRRVVGRQRLDAGTRQALALNQAAEAGATLASELDEVADWWLADDAAGQRQARAAAALVRGRFAADAAAVAAQFFGEPPPLFAPLLAELLRLAKPTEAFARLQPLWAQAANLPEADRAALRDGYLAAARAAARAAQDRTTPDWAALAAALDALVELTPGDASIGLARAEAVSMAADKPLPPTRRMALMEAVTAAPDSPYRTYVAALLATEPGEAATAMLRAFPDGREPTAELRADYRRAEAARRLRVAARSRLTADPPPFADPLPEASKSEVAAWLDRAETFSPPPIGDQAIRAIAAWPGDANRAHNLTTGLSDDRIVRDLGPFAAWVLWVKARSHAEGTIPVQLVALSSYERLGLLLREQYLRRPPDDPRRVSARAVAARALDPALALGDRLAAALPPEFKRKLGELYAEKGRLVSAAANVWSADVRSAVVEAVAAFDNALRYDDKSPASAAYMVEKALARGKEPRLAPSLDELNAVANRAADLDPFSFLPPFLKGRYQQLGGFEFTRRAGDYRKAERLFQEALDSYNRAREQIRQSDHPDRPEYEADIIAGTATIYAWLGHSAGRAETRAEFRARATAAFDELAGLTGHANANAYDLAGRHFESRGTPADYARADGLYRTALHHADDAAILVDLGRSTVKWVVFGGKGWAALGDARDQLVRAIRQDDRTAHLAEAHFWLGQALRWQGRFDEAREQYAQACRRAPDSAAYWSDRLAALIDEMDQQPAKHGGGGFHDIAAALAGRRDDSLRATWRRAGAYARFVDGATPDDVRDTLGLSADFTASDAESVMRLFPWAIALVYRDGDLPLDTGHLRRLTDQLSQSASVLDDPAVAARAEYLASRLRLRTATGDADRRAALQVFAQAVRRINPAAPLLSAWREALARDLMRLGQSPTAAPATRRADLEAAADLARDALAHGAGPRSDGLQRLLAEIRHNLDSLK